MLLFCVGKLVPQAWRCGVVMERVAALSGGGVTGDSIFDAGSPGNRDNCYEPYIALQQAFARNGIALHTRDCCDAGAVAFDISINAEPGEGQHPSYALLLETPFIHPGNGDAAILAQYRKLFTWDDRLVDGERFVKINFPNPVSVPVADGMAGRDVFCCVIAGNKRVAVPTRLELYSERVRVIRWFEKHAPSDFALYGIGWDSPSPAEGPVWKPLRKLRRSWKKRTGGFAFPSYRGVVSEKKAVLQKARFCICYENVRDLPGYITEKIFDCFFHGCVPVYWGAGNVHDYVPEDCFIDRRRFASTAAVYRHLKAMDEATFVRYQQNIIRFLQSEKMYPFSTGHFVTTVVDTVLADIDANR